MQLHLCKYLTLRLMTLTMREAIKKKTARTHKKCDWGCAHNKNKKSY